MLGKCFSVIVLCSFVCAIFTGNVEALANAVIDGAGKAVTVTIAMGGMMCLWSGIMHLLKGAGAIRLLSSLFAPLLRFAFPEAYRTGVGREEITANLAANLLGIGNAATPLALSAMQKMQAHNPNKTTATDDMATLAVLNCSSIGLIPTTLIALRRNAGSAVPYRIIVPVILVSAVCATLSVVFSRLCSKLRHG